jgi:signal transduction histidine kinase
VDSAVAGAVLAVGYFELTGVIPGSVFPGNSRFHAVFIVLTAAPLVLRRVYPVSMMLAVGAVTSVWQYTMYSEVQQPPFEPFIALLIVVFGAGMYTVGRRARAALVAVAAGLLAAVIDIVAGKPLGSAIPPMLMIIGVFVLGTMLAGYRIKAEAAAVRADRLARHHEAQRAAAVVEERSRIARELHDVITHDVSLMVMQAAVERRLHSGAPDGALGSIEAIGRDALGELRRMLGVLRSPDGGVPLRPQPGLGQIGDLVAQCALFGLDVTLVVEGTAAPLSPGLDLAVYRIVQESLTNMAKHAGATTAVITIRHLLDCLEIEIVDDGPALDHVAVGPAAPADEIGRHGLVGMRERAALYSGTVESGPRDGRRGYRVCVRLPKEQPL